MKDKWSLSDNELETPAQMQVKALVQALPEDTVSLAWRSELNTKLLAQAARRKRLDLFGWVCKPAAGLAVTAAVATLFIARTPSTPGKASGVETAIMATYMDSARSADVAMGGIVPEEAKENAAPTAPIDLGQEDVTATL